MITVNTRTNGERNWLLGHQAQEADIGFGDQLIATGLARGAHARHKRIAFGDGHRIIWDQRSAKVFQDNPNIANPQGCYPPDTIEWIPFYKGNRGYNSAAPGRWIWNYDFHVKRGEVFIGREELILRTKYGRGFVVMEPMVSTAKMGVMNKQWSVERYDQVAEQLRAKGYTVVQFMFNHGHRIPDAQQIPTRDFREALAILQKASLYLGTEGGLHHGAAAVGTKAVVIFGGWVPPAVLGYEGHINLTGGAEEACGLFQICSHCRQALNRITTDEVVAAALDQLRQ